MANLSGDSDSLTKQQQEFLKSLGKKALDFLVRIAPISQFAKDGYRLGREMSKAAKSIDDLSDDPGELSSSDYSINKLSQLSRYLDSQTVILARRDENWWIAAAGVDLLNKERTTEALQMLQNQRNILLDLSDCCDGLATLAKVAIAANNLSIKSLAKMYMPSIVAIDAAVTKQTLDHLDNCKNSIARAQGVLENAIRGTADSEKAVDRFLMLLNSSDQRKALNSMQQSAGGK